MKWIELNDVDERENASLGNRDSKEKIYLFFFYLLNIFVF